MSAAAAPSILRIGDIAPDFTAESTTGLIKFHEFLGDSWAILFSHPADNTPICTTELGAVARLKDTWSSRNTKVIALSCDPLDKHMAWKGDIEETQGHAVEYPIIADDSREVATLYNMLDKNNKDKAGLPLTVRSVFVIDPAKTIRLILTYPASVGRNFDEVVRALDALQLTTAYKVATPVNWQPGNDVIVPASIPTEEAQAKYPDLKVLKPYLRFTADPSKKQ